MSTTTQMKQVVFIRHAQSDNNVRFQNLTEGISKIQNWNLPSTENVLQSLSLLRVEMNSEVSALGQQQIVDMANILKENNFWESFNPELIIHSPLIRAKTTCFGLLPSNIDQLSIPIIEFDDIKEATITEHLNRSALLTRIARFQQWLAARSETRIVMVGHSLFYRKMLNQKSHPRNCDVWEINANCHARASEDILSQVEWVNPRLLYRSILTDLKTKESQDPKQNEENTKSQYVEQEQQLPPPPPQAHHQDQLQQQQEEVDGIEK